MTLQDKQENDMENKENTLQKPGFWKAFGAYSIDIVIMLIIYLMSISKSSGDAIGDACAILFGPFMILFIYFIVCRFLFGKSFGKVLVGLFHTTIGKNMENKKEVGTYPWWQAALANAIDMLIFGMGSLISFLVYSRPVNNMSDTAVVFLLALPFLFMFVTMGLYVWPKIWGKRTLGQIIMKCPCPIISDQQKDKPKSFVSKYFYYVFGPLGATYYCACLIDVGLIGGMSIVSLFLIMISSKSIYMTYAMWLLPLMFGFYWFLYYTLTDIFFDATLGELLFKVDRTPKTK